MPSCQGDVYAANDREKVAHCVSVSLGKVAEYLVADMLSQEISVSIFLCKYDVVVDFFILRPLIDLSLLIDW